MVKVPSSYLGLCGFDSRRSYQCTDGVTVSPVLLCPLVGKEGFPP